MKSKVLELVLFLKLARVREARSADVNGSDAGVRLAKGVSCCLRRAATGDQYFLTCARLAGGPDEVELGSPPIRIAVKLSVFVQAGERGRVGHSFVEIAELRQVGIVRLHASLRVQFDFHRVA